MLTSQSTVSPSSTAGLWPSLPLTSLPFLAPTVRVAAAVALARRRHLALGAVDADLAVERLALRLRRARAVVALHVLAVLRPVPSGLVGEDLLHAALCRVDIQLGGDEQAG